MKELFETYVAETTNGGAHYADNSVDGILARGIDPRMFFERLPADVRVRLLKDEDSDTVRSLELELIG